MLKNVQFNICLFLNPSLYTLSVNRGYKKGRPYDVVKTPKVNKSTFRQSQLHLGPKYFNQLELPLHVKDISNINQFCAES